MTDDPISRIEATMLRRQRDALQAILDRRPAINDGLREAYAVWSAEVYAMEARAAVGEEERDEKNAHKVTPLYTHPQPQQAGVPEGWKLVPVEPPSAQAEPTIDINIKIAVPANWSNRLDMQWIVEREIHADRWSWSYAAPQAMNTQADAIEALRDVVYAYQMMHPVHLEQAIGRASAVLAAQGGDL